MMKHVARTSILLIILLLAACAPEDGDPLPTRAELPPTSADTPREELPPTFTPTATETATPSPTTTPTVTLTPSMTITDTPSPTATITPSPTDLPTIAPEERPLLGLLEEAMRATVLPNSFLPSGSDSGIEIIGSPTIVAGGAPGVVQPPQPAAPSTNCAFFPPGGFGNIYASNPDFARQIGCPAGNPPDVLTRAGAIQPFENGLMIWLDPHIYVLYSASDSFIRFNDTFQEGVDPETSDETAPAGLQAPVRGFLKVWQSSPDIRSGLGWATQPETGGQTTTLSFQNGMMIWFQNRPDTIALISTDGGAGVWRVFSGGF